MTLADLRQIGFPPTYSKLQVAELLKERYPEYTWEKVFLLKGRYAQQRRLEKTVAALFPVRSFPFLLLVAKLFCRH